MDQLRRTARSACAVAAIVALLTAVLPAEPAVADTRTAAQIRDRMEYLVNRQRARHGVRRLRVNDRMQYFARGHSLEMAYRGFIYHDSRLALEIASSASAWGENVARTRSSDAALTAHRMFMRSAGHRANILRPRWTHMGIGIVKRNGYVYVTQRFADRW